MGAKVVEAFQVVAGVMPHGVPYVLAGVAIALAAVFWAGRPPAGAKQST